MVVDPVRDRESPKRKYSPLAAQEMAITRTRMALADCWPALNPGVAKHRGFTLGEPGERRRYDTWDASVDLMGGHLGVVSCTVIPAIRLSVPRAKSSASALPQKGSDHDGVLITIRISAAKRPSGEPRVHQGVLADHDLRRRLRDLVKIFFCPLRTEDLPPSLVPGMYSRTSGSCDLRLS